MSVPSALAPPLDVPTPATAQAPPATARARRLGHPATVSWIVGVHLSCLLVFVVGVSWTAVLVALGFYALRMFAITAGYHRYFSHRSYDTSRAFSFLMGALGATAVQGSPLWWASTHRHHHRNSDTLEDVHSPIRDGFWWSHLGWMLSGSFMHTNEASVRDLARFPELRWLDRFWWIAPILAGLGIFALGAWLGAAHPGLGTNGFQLLVWGFGVSTVLLYHGCWSVNSLLHLFGSRRFPTKDESRNNLWVALYTFGEGWHNNHHRFAASARQGFYFGEIDVSYGILCVLEKLGIVWNVRRPSAALLAEGRANAATRSQAGS